MNHLTKERFAEIVQSVGVPAREGENYLDDAKTFPKIAYWEYVWDDTRASGEAYDTVVTYQLSFASRTARHEKLLALKKALNDEGLHPVFYHEYVKGANGPGYHHTYCAVDVTETLTTGGGS